MKPLGHAVPEGVLLSCSSLLPLVNSKEKMRITEQEWHSQGLLLQTPPLSNPQTPWPSRVYWSHPDLQQLSPLRCYLNSNKIPFFTFYIYAKERNHNWLRKTQTNNQQKPHGNMLGVSSPSKLDNKHIWNTCDVTGKERVVYSIFKEMFQIWPE